MDGSDKLDRARDAIVQAAEALLAGRIGVIEASRTIAWNAHIIDPKMDDDDLLGFIGIESQTDHLLVGPLLEEWHPSVREQKRAEVGDAEAFHRNDAFHAARALVERYRRAT